MSDATSYERYPRTAFALSLAAGILIVIGGLVAMLWAYVGTPFWNGMVDWHTSGGEMMHHEGFGRMWIFGGMATLGLIFGILVLVSAILLRSRPESYTTWGVLILVFSILSFLGLGGFLIGAVIGIVGGALALTWKPTMAR